MSRVICLLLISLALQACATTAKSPSNKEQATIPFQELIDQKLTANGKYTVVIQNENDRKMEYYGDENAIGKGSQAMATGWDHIVFYSNYTGMKRLAAVRIYAFMGDSADPNKEFSVEILSSRFEVLCSLAGLKYSTFKKATQEWEYQDFPVNVTETPKDFYIRVRTRSSKESSLFIRNIPTNGMVFSFEHLGDTKYREYTKSNAAIIPVFE